MAEEQFNVQDADLHSLYRAVGAFIVNWGSAEMALDMAVALLYREHGGRAITKRKRIPKQLEVKLRFVRDCVSKIPALSAHKDLAEDMAQRFERLAPTRHDLVHGAIADLVPEGTVFAFAKLDHDEPDIHTLREFGFDAEHFPKLYDDVIAMGRAAIDFVQALLAPLRGGGHGIP